MKKTLAFIATLFVASLSFGQQLPQYLDLQTRNALGNYASSLTIGGNSVKGKVSAMLVATNAQTIPTTTPTILALQSNYWNYGMLACTNNGVNVPRTGLYRVTGSIIYGANQVTENKNCTLKVYVNNAYKAILLWNAQGVANTFAGGCNSCVIQCSSNDFINVYTYQDSAGSANTYFESPGQDCSMCVESAD